MRLSGTKRPGLMTLPRLPLVALIDVVLFLLLYFMIAANFATEEAELASALQTDRRGGAGAAGALLPQVVRIEPGASGRAVYKLGDRVMEGKAALAEVLRQLPKEGGVFLRVDGGVTAEAVAAGLQACKDAGFSKISYVPGS